MKIIWAVPARRDLEEIRAYIREQNPAAARGVASRIRSAVAHLKLNPRMGRIVPVEIADLEGVHELVIGGTPYIVPYLVEGNRIVLLRVWDARRGVLW